MLRRLRRSVTGKPVPRQNDRLTDRRVIPPEGGAGDISQRRLLTLLVVLCTAIPIYMVARASRFGSIGLSTAAKQPVKRPGDRADA